MPFQFTPSDIERFWAKVNKNGPIPAHRPELGPCWVWTGEIAGRYGRFWAGARRFSAHRLAWAITNGPIPEGLRGLHQCDNPICVNPSHLFTGTDDDNMKDKVAKGRQAKGDGHASRLYPGLHQGERNGSAKLTAEQVRDIRAIYAKGGIRQVDLAEQFAVDQTLISLIVREKIWNSVA